MASKAMNWFRKHQKMILAIVTIGTMLIFIVGDAVQAMGRGGGRSGGIIGWFENVFGGAKDDTIIRIAGSNYTTEQLKQLELYRQFALEVMNGVSSEGEKRYLLDLGIKEEDMKDQNKVQRMLADLESKDPAIRDARTTRDNSVLGKIQPSITTFYMAREIEAPESVAEFLMMRSKANDLGVSVTNSTIKDSLLRLGMGKVSIDEITSLVRNSARARGFSDLAKVDTVLNILADEVRVSIVKQIVNEDLSKTILERAYSRAGIPFPGGNRPQVTPGDMWEQYVSVKTSLSTGILPMKVEDFISKVPDPTAEEKQQYFEKYKKEFPSTEKDTPGFKIPPMYRIGLVFADMKDGAPARKHYQGQVDAWDRIAPLNALAELASAYESKKNLSYRNTQAFVEFATGKLASSPWVRVYRWQSHQDHAHLASILGNFAINALQVGTFSPGNAFVMSLQGEAVPPQHQEYLSLLQGIAGATSLPGLLQPALTFRSGSKDAFIPFGVVASALIEQRYETKSREYLQNDLTELTNTLNDYAKKYSEWRGKVLRKLIPAGTPPYFKDDTKQTLQDYLTKFAAARGLVYGETKDLRTKDNLLVENDDRLLNARVRPLYYDASERSTPRQLDDFVRYILAKNETGGEKPKLFEATNSTVYDSSRKNKEIVLTWVAEASDPRTPDFKEAEPAVVKAWKMEKARALVEEEANKIVKDISNADNFRKLIDMKGYAPGQTIARYTEPELTSSSPMPMYKPCPIPKVVDNQPDDFVKQCLDKLKKKGDTTVIADKTKSVYYLIYLSNRSEPKTDNPVDVENFHNEVIRPSMSRQMVIDNVSFRNFVEIMEKGSNTSSWVEYLKAVSGLNTEKAKLYYEAMQRNR